MKKLLISTFAAAVMLLFGGGNEVNADPLTYEVVGDAVTIKDCKETASGTLAIPPIYDGKPVTRIGSWAFWKCTSLTSVTIPDSVTSVGNFTFHSCSSLKSITFKGNAPSSLGTDVFKYLPIGATITVPVGATGFGETFGGLPVIIQGELEINTFSKSAAPFSLNFGSISGLTYIIDASHDLKEWGEIGEAQGTGSSVEFTDWQKALFQRQYFRVKLVE